MRYQIKHGIVKYAADTILDDINFEIRDSEKTVIVAVFSFFVSVQSGRIVDIAMGTILFLE